MSTASRALVFLAVLLTPLLAAAAAKDDYSKYCRPPETDASALRDGTYEGTWEQVVKAQRQLGNAPMIQTYVTKGKFKLLIDRAGAEQRRSQTRLDGELETTLEASAPSVKGTVQRMGGGKMKLLELTGGTFRAVVDGRVEGQLRAPGLNQKQSGGGKALVTFDTFRATCQDANGKVSVDLMDQTAATLRTAGWQVEQPPPRWEMKRIDDGLEEERKKLEEELRKAPPPGIVRTQEREAKRLFDIAERIYAKDAALWECLFETWQGHVERQLSTWVSDEAAKLRAYQGDFLGLSEHARSGLSGARALAMVGRDTCSENLHRTLFAAIDVALSRYLKGMIEGKAPQRAILEALTQAELLGVVAPRLQKEVWDSIRAQAKEQADQTWKAYEAARAAAPKTDPAVAQALRRALLAETSAQLVGVDLNRAVNEGAK